MKKIYARAALLIMTLTLAAPPAMADRGFASSSVNLRAGPDAGYPVVARVPAYARVEILGCANGYSWCDVVWGPNRGWVNGRYLEMDYYNERRYITDLGPTANVPVVTFSFNDYWDNHYYGRRFYRDRDRYRSIFDRNDHHWDNDNHRWNDHHDNDQDHARDHRFNRDENSRGRDRWNH